MADESVHSVSLYEDGGSLDDFFDSLDDDVDSLDDDVDSLTDDVGSRAGDSSTLSAGVVDILAAHSPP